ncbi:MAG: GNAT family N-acetyltransferase [Firmicutes bacterium]|nr:GNAT family N-acetyltransferase [Bacillota bacterium]
MIVYKSEIPAEAYNNMRLAVGWKGLDLAQAERGLKNSAYLTAAWDDDTPVGMARVISDGGYMTLIVDVMVLPAYQGRGIGRQLLTNINEWLDSLGREGLCIMVNLMATTGNEGFYEKFGFEVRPNDRMGAGMVRWINP